MLVAAERRAQRRRRPSGRGAAPRGIAPSRGAGAPARPRPARAAASRPRPHGPAPRAPRPARSCDRRRRCSTPSQPAAIACTAASGTPYAAAIAFISRSSLRIDAVEPELAAAACRRRSPATASPGRSSSSAGTRTCAVMMTATSASIAARNGTNSTASQPIGRMLDERQLEMRIGARVAMPGKVLAARGDARRPAASRMIAAPKPRHVLGALRQRAVADDRVLRVRVDVEHRRVVERDADRLAAPPPAPRANRSASASSPLRPSVAIGGHSVNGALQPRDAPALLIDADPERQLRRERLRLARRARPPARAPRCCARRG